MTMQVNIHEAKTKLSSILNRVASGEEVVIAKAGRPIARIVPFSEGRQQRTSGRYAGLGHIAADFDAPLSAFEDHFYGS